MASVSSLSGPVTRTFRIHNNARVYSVQLFHNTVSGDRMLSVDGAEVVGTSGRTTVFQSPTPLMFTIGDATGSVTITPHGATIEYRCVYAGEAISEENSIVNGSASAQGGMDAEANRLKLNIEAGDLGVESNGKAVVLFRIHTVRELDLRETTVHRRFRDFFAVNEALRSAYKGSHLLSSFPPLPPRSLKLFEDHMSMAFIEKRRWQLQDWMFKVSQIPRIRTNPDFQTFLGMIDNVRECSLIFPGGAPLGLSLKASQGSSASSGNVEVTAVTHDCPVANAALLIRPGDKISKINGDDVMEDSYDLLIAKLKAAPRPLCIHFLGILPSLPAGAQTASAAPITIPLHQFGVAQSGALLQQSAQQQQRPPPQQNHAVMGLL